MFNAHLKTCRSALDTRGTFFRLLLSSRNLDVLVTRRPKRAPNVRVTYKSAPILLLVYTLF